MLEKETSKRRSSKSFPKGLTKAAKHDHPDHSIHIKRLNRAKGQIEGIERMITDRRYCTDIIAQLRAASAALKAIEAEILKSHLRRCVKSAFNGDDAFDAEEKIQEIIKLVY